MMPHQIEGIKSLMSEFYTSSSGVSYATYNRHYISVPPGGGKTYLGAFKMLFEMEKDLHDAAMRHVASLSESSNPDRPATSSQAYEECIARMLSPQSKANSVAELTALDTLCLCDGSIKSHWARAMKSICPEFMQLVWQPTRKLNNPPRSDMPDRRVRIMLVTYALVNASMRLWNNYRFHRKEWSDKAIAKNGGKRPSKRPMMPWIMKRRWGMNADETHCLKNLVKSSAKKKAAKPSDTNTSVSSSESKGKAPRKKKQTAEAKRLEKAQKLLATALPTDGFTIQLTPTAEVHDVPTNVSASDSTIGTGTRLMKAETLHQLKYRWIAFFSGTPISSNKISELASVFKLFFTSGHDLEGHERDMDVMQRDVPEGTVDTYETRDEEMLDEPAADIQWFNGRSYVDPEIVLLIHRFFYTKSESESYTLAKAMGDPMGTLLLAPKKENTRTHKLTSMTKEAQALIKRYCAVIRKIREDMKKDEGSKKDKAVTAANKRRRLFVMALYNHMDRIALGPKLVPQVPKYDLDPSVLEADKGVYPDLFSFPAMVHYNLSYEMQQIVEIVRNGLHFGRRLIIINDEVRQLKLIHYVLTSLLSLLPFVSLDTMTWTCAMRTMMSNITLRTPRARFLVLCQRMIKTASS
jgi:hypothetical protein